MIITSTPTFYSFSPSLYRGTHMIYGTVKNAGTPNYSVFRRVRLHEQKSGILVKEIFSDAITGEYSFTYIKNTVYYVVAFDHTMQYNSVIASDVSPIPMP